MIKFIEQMAKAYYEDLPIQDGINPAFKVSWDELEPGTRERIARAMGAALRLLPDAPTEIIHAGAFHEQRSSPISGLRDALQGVVDKLLETP